MNENQTNETLKPIKKHRISSVMKSLSEILFYALIGLIIVLVVLQNQRPDEAKTLFDTSIFYIQTDSMRSVMPRGSLIVTHRDDPETLEVGEYITYYTKINGKVSIVTHEIVEVIDNYEGNGLAFSTKGVDNDEIDKEKVYAANVIGEVKLTVPQLGIYISYIKENYILSGVIVILIIAFKNSASDYLKELKKERKNVIDL
ncbi:hypothetical protein AOC36_08020 [Erysipelothrix larvae]|uniref:Signal peptidase I n=1 Tax=Erysipelothrix larvae TaxID=1514105 RepID=A0A109UHC2_9FIRM|nr:signal peptidase I [Erysipelothrix larvae]AMC93933.1 hypothetical protein AOC36_08020 [Erysipelothrix larvae]